MRKTINGKLHYFEKWGKVGNGEITRIQPDGCYQAALDLYEQQREPDGVIRPQPGSDYVRPVQPRRTGMSSYADRLGQRTTHGALQFGQAAMVLGHRLVVHVALSVELPFGVQ